MNRIKQTMLPPIQEPKSRKRQRSLKRRLRRLISQPLLRLALVVLPQCYCWYMRLVWRTSKIEYYGVEKPLAGRQRDGKCICALWHENVFFVAYIFRELYVSTLASVSDFGHLITRMLQLCNFEVFRGGSSRGHSRQRSQVVPAMIEHMQQHDNILYGITVDGSYGPRYHTKRGVVLIARATGSPVYAVHIACKPSLRIPSWDRTRIALPFSHIVCVCEGPYYCPPDTPDEQIASWCQFLDQVIMDNMQRAQHYLDSGTLPPPARGLRPLACYYQPSQLRRGASLLPPGEFALQPVPKLTAIL